MSKTPAWYGQMWLIIIDFHLAFLRQPADQKKKKRKVPITMCTRSVMDGAGARVTWEIQFRRIRVLITFLELSRGRGAPQIIQWPRACLRVWCQLLLLTGRIHRARLLPLLGYSFLISKVGVLIHCITLLGHHLMSLWSHLIWAGHNRGCPCSGTLRAPHSPPALRLTCFLWCMRCHKTHWVPLRIVDRGVKVLGWNFLQWVLGSSR